MNRSEHKVRWEMALEILCDLCALCAGITFPLKEAPIADALHEHAP